MDYSHVEDEFGTEIARQFFDFVAVSNEIKTSKKDEPEMHGIGIKNIIQIVEKYNGEYVIKNENNEFSFSIIIPL